MATCCGADRATAFCPDCGKRLAGDAKAELLAHLRKRVKTEQTKLRKLHEYIGARPAEGQEQETHRREMTAAYERHVAKWQSWLDWVLKQGE